MELIAAIDLLGGRARRLVRGEYDRPIEPDEDPLQLARRWLGAGVPRLHVVDLDGALIGRPVNAPIVAGICTLVSEVAPSAKVQCGGGLRDAEAVELLLESGVDEVILGSAALTEPAFLAECAARWPGRVGVALDLRDGRPAIEGWTREIASDPIVLAAELLAAGASRLLVTDVARDGTGAGPNLDLLARFRRRFPEAVLLSAGGVATTADLAALAGLGIDGAVVGRALLDGSLTIEDALAACAPGVHA